MSARRVIEIFLNTEADRQVAPGGGITNDILVLHRTSQALLRINLRDNDVNFVTIVAGATWLFAIDNTFTADSPDLVVSQNDQFNIVGDWAGVDPDNGKVSVRVNLNTTNLKNALSGKDSEVMIAELWYTPVGGDPVLFVQFDVFVKNHATEIDDDTPLEFFSSGLLAEDPATGDIVMRFPRDGSVVQRWRFPG